ncbi:MAG: (d)CMP kinase, partial [Anaerolineae bacterium]
MSPAGSGGRASKPAAVGSNSSKQSQKPSTIAIDGPAASGKSSVGMRVADRLGYRYLDTGAMYRAVTWVVLQRELPVDDQERVEGLAAALHLEIVPPTEDDGRQ